MILIIDRLEFVIAVELEGRDNVCLSSITACFNRNRLCPGLSRISKVRTQGLYHVFFEVFPHILGFDGIRLMECSLLVCWSLLNIVVEGSIVADHDIDI